MHLAYKRFNRPFQDNLAAIDFRRDEYANLELSFRVQEQVKEADQLRGLVIDGRLGSCKK